MSDFDQMQNSTAVNHRGLPNDATASSSVPPPPAYPGHGGQALPSGPGLLRTKISLGGRKPTVILPFTLMKPDLPAASPINGSMNLLTYYGLDHALNKFCAPNKKLKEELSAFLPHLPGNIDTPGNQDNSSLRSLIDKPPITGKEILPLSTSALAGFKLQPGPIPETYRVFAGAYGPSRSAQGSTAMPAADEKSGHHSRKKHKRKHERSGRGSEDRPGDGASRDEKSHNLGISAGMSGIGMGADSGTSAALPSGEAEESRKSKGDDGGVSEKKKKKKKDKKRKRSRSPDHGTSSAANNPPSASTYSTTDFDF